jgi:diguanylate cyclase (GGDEF)-like protein
MAWWTRRWWRQSDQFDWFSAYIERRGLGPTWRAATFGSTALLAGLPILMLQSPEGPSHPATVTLSVIAACAGAIGAGLWLMRWPTRRQSILFSALACGSIAATCLAQSNPYAGLMGCTVFAVIGGFIAYFHTVGYVGANLVVAVGCSAILAYRLVSATGDIALTASSLLTVAALNIGVPFGIHSLVHSLRTDLRSSDRDPLTNLLNRRSFNRSAYELLMRHQHAPGSHLIVAMIDLDNFKQVNDTRGHAAGDQALVGVSAVLLDACRTSAVIGRVGGEEFVIADIDRTHNPAELAERLRQAIAALPFQISASIGTTSAPLDSPVVANQRILDGLIGAADTAMYAAKRAGGNRVCHHDGIVPSDRA